MERIFDSCRLVRGEGQKEYAHDESNALANFERGGREMELPREKVLWIYARKHIDGIVAYINGHRSQREPVQGRIKDLIVYLCLLQCMIEDDERRPNIDKNGNYDPTIDG
jgi:hypothetical protein